MRNEYNLIDIYCTRNNNGNDQLLGFHDDGLKSFPLLTGLSVVSCGPLNEREEAWPKSKRRISTDKHRFVLTLSIHVTCHPHTNAIEAFTNLVQAISILPCDSVP